MKLERIIQNYQLRFDELNSFYTEILSYSYEENGEGGYEKAKRKFEECLFWFYVDGFSSGILMTGESREMPNGYEFLDIRYPDNETVNEKFEKHFKSGDDKKLSALLESEAHRMYNTGSLSALGITFDVKTGQPLTATGKPSGFKKTWVTMDDEKVRDTHWYLEGETIPVEDEFVTFDGDYAMAPGMFQTAQNNANCRCILAYSRG